MSFMNDLAGDNGAGQNLLQRMGNTLVDSAKDVSNAVFEKKLAAESDPVKRAALVVAQAGAQYLINKAVAKDRQKIPKAYTGDPVDLREQLYISTPDHAYNTYFRKTKAGDHAYNEAHPMYNSLFLVDFVFNPMIVSEIEKNPLFGLFRDGFPMSTTFLLKSSTFPKVNFEMVKLNQYNKAVYKPKKVIYDQVNMTFHDIYTPITSTNAKRVSLMNLMKEYLSYYTNDIVREEFNLRNGLNTDREHEQFINRINIYLFWNSGAKIISMVNPTIQNFSYSDLNYEDDNALTLSCGIDYQYLEMSDMEMTTDEFIGSASHLLDEIADGFVPEGDKSVNDLDRGVLEPMKRDQFKDAQRRVGLDNPVAAMAIRLAETQAMQKHGARLSDPDPVKRAVAEGAYRLAMDGAAAATNAVSGLARGIF